MSDIAPGGRRTVRVRIEGRVQGVGFRYWTEAAATGLGLDGWVRNRRDGGVEAVFSGAAQDVAEMIERCRRGPSAARVDAVKVLEEPISPPQGFEVHATV
jgi:acylphosphatase